MVCCPRFQFFLAKFSFVQIYTGNNIGVDGAAQIAKALKVNTTLTVLILGCEWIVLLGRCMLGFVLLIVNIPHVCDPIRQCNWWYWRETACWYVESEHNTDWTCRGQWVWFICRLFECFRCVADILNDCVYCGLDNQIGDNGVIDIAEALKVNSTLVDVSWTGTNISLFSFTSHPREQEL